MTVLRDSVKNYTTCDSTPGPPASILVPSVLALGVVNGVAWLVPETYLLSFIGQTALLCLVWNLSVFRSFMVGTVSGMIALGIAFHWAPYSISDTTNLPKYWPTIVFLALIAWESVVFGGWCGTISWMKKFHRNAVWLSPFIWVVFEYFWPRVFTWALAHSHSQFLPVLQIAEIGGTSAVSALIVLAACTCFTLLYRNEFQLLHSLAALAIVMGCLGYGIIRMRQVDSQMASSRQVQVAALQLDPSYDDSIAKLQAQSVAFDHQVDLILWPETSIGHYEDSLTHFRDPIRVSELSEAPNPAEDPSGNLSKAMLLAGGKVYSSGARNNGPYLNTAFLISPTKDIVDRYYKRSLMPIGEYIPLGDQFPSLKHWAAITTPLIPGSSDKPLQLPSGPRVGTLICYEDMERENARRTTLCGAECLVVLINGVGFPDEDALRQHERLAMLRTIENRRGMLRCGATGLTCYISPTGRVEQQLPVFTEGQIVAAIPLMDHLTIYSRFGEWFTWLSTLIVVFTVILLKGRAYRARSLAGQMLQ